MEDQCIGNPVAGPVLQDSDGGWLSNDSPNKGDLSLSEGNFEDQLVTNRPPSPSEGSSSADNADNAEEQGLPKTLSDVNPGGNFGSINLAVAFKNMAGNTEPMQQNHGAVLFAAIAQLQTWMAQRDQPKDTNEGEPKAQHDYERQERPGALVKLHLLIREHAKLMMGRTDLEEVNGCLPITSVEMQHIQLWARNPARFGGPTEDEFKLFLDFDNTTAPQRKLARTWNKRAGNIFTKSFLEKHPSYEEEEDVVRTHFQTHVRKALTKQYTNFIKPMDAADVAELRKRFAIEQRRINRHNRRIKTCAFFKAYPDMARYHQYLKHEMPWKVTSGDESDSVGPDEIQRRRLVISRIQWRAEEVRGWMQTLDSLDLALRFTNGARPTPGSFPRPRFDPLKFDPPRDLQETWSTGYVPGLPENFYDKAWLESLPPHDREELKPLPPVSLEFPNEVIDFAQTAARVLNRDTLPRPSQPS